MKLDRWPAYTLAYFDEVHEQTGKRLYKIFENLRYWKLLPVMLLCGGNLWAIRAMFNN